MQRLRGAAGAVLHAPIHAAAAGCKLTPPPTHTQHPSMENLSNSLPGRPFLVRAYAALSRMSVMNEYLTHKAGYTRGGEGGMSRTAQYLRFLVSGTEQLRMIKLYRCDAAAQRCLQGYSTKAMQQASCCQPPSAAVRAHACPHSLPHTNPGRPRCCGTRARCLCTC